MRLCKPCARYLDAFYFVTPRQGMSVRRCECCGRIGLHKHYRVVSRQAQVGLINTWEGGKLCAQTSRRVWERLKAEFRAVPYSTQQRLCCAPKTQNESELRQEFWRRLAKDALKPEDAKKVYQDLCAWYDELC